MELDYRQNRKIIQIRMKQIKDIALEDERYNREYMLLNTIYKRLSDLIILERKDVEGN